MDAERTENFKKCLSGGESRLGGEEGRRGGFGVLTHVASSVNGKTSKKIVQKRRGGVWCV